MKFIFKKLLLAISLTCALMLTSVCFIASAEESVTAELGDVNADGKINASDALVALRSAAKLQNLDELTFKNADVNKDNTVNATDALLILKVAAHIIPDFSEESINATPTPMPPTEIAKQNVKKIKDHISANGYDDGEGYKYLSYSYGEDPVYTTITYYESKDVLEFDLSYVYPSDTGEFGGVSTFMTYGPVESAMTFYVGYMSSEIEQYYQATSTISTKSITPDAKINFTEYDSYNCSNEEKSQMISLAPDYATTALYLWDDLLKTEFGLSMSDIGYTELVY